MPIFLGICGVLEILVGLMTLAGASSMNRHIAGVLLIGFGLLTFGFGAVVYELQSLRRQQRRQAEAHSERAATEEPPARPKKPLWSLPGRG